MVKLLMVDMNFIKKDLLNDKIIYWLIFASPAVLLSMPRGWVTGVTVLLLLIAVFMSQAGYYKNIAPHEKFMVAVILFYFIAALPNVIIDIDNARVLDGPARYLLVIPIYFFLKNAVSSGKAFNYYLAGSIAGGAGAFMVGGYELLFQAEKYAGRGDGVGGFLYSINFGYMAALLAFNNIIGFFYYEDNKKYLFLVGGVLAGCALTMSASRGAVFTFMVAFIVLGVLLIRRRGCSATKYTLVFAVLTSLLLVSFYTIKQFNARVSNFFAKVSLYAKTPDDLNRINYRFEIWRNNFPAIKAHPFFGSTYDERRKLVRQQIKSRKITKPNIYADYPKNYNHAHSEFIEALAATGLFGALSLLFFYAYFLWRFGSNLSDDDKPRRFIALTGFFIVLQFILFGLTEAPMLANSNSAFFIASLAVLLSAQNSLPVKNAGHA